jgi:hypothetical protein
MYRGKLDNISQIAVEFFKASDKYKIEGLKVGLSNIFLTNFIVQNLSGETFFEAIILAYMYNCDVLKTAVYWFLAKNSTKGHFSELISSIKWINFSSEVIKDIHKKMNFNY